MDVRCDRCETEYELDDAIVTDTGASVQCTTCGHTFVVNRQGVTSPAPSRSKPAGPTPPGGISDSPGPDMPEWTLSTDDGKVHRFRDLNVLQKWIVERKVTRTERISRLGGPWLSLGDVVELAPFFAVVDEADRARAAIPTPATSFAAAGTPPVSSRPPPGMIPPSASRGAGAARSNGSPSNPIASGSAPPPNVGGRVSEDGPTVPNRRLSGMMAAEAAAGPSTPVPGTPGRAAEPKPGIRPPDDRTPMGSANVAAARANAAAPRAATRTELVFGSGKDVGLLDSELLEQSHTGRNIAIAAVLLLLAGGGAGAWWYTQRGPGSPTTSAPRGMAAETAAPAKPVPAPSAASGANPTHPANPANSPNPPPVAAEGAETAPAAANPEPAAAPKKPAAAEGEGGAPKVASVGPGAGAARGRGGAKGMRGNPVADAGVAQVHGGSYDQLVREADRLLDAGKSAKADKLYTQALAARPDGVAALTGSAYVLLDRQRHFKAIETFRRALAVQPGYGPALFGIAESYRARGDTAQALGAYRQYLAVAPNGTDAPAARRQIKDLESAAPPAAPVDRPPAPSPTEP